MMKKAVAVLLAAVLCLAAGCAHTGDVPSAPIGTTTAGTVSTTGTTEAIVTPTTTTTAAPTTTTTTVPTNTGKGPAWYYPVIQTPQGAWPSPFVKYYDYVTPGDMDNNVFMDALVYTGYNIEKQKADNLMWEYIILADKDHRGWLSDIFYGGGSSGYETTADGKPNIAHFEQRGLVCASFVTYVYFNYLPNVAGIDVSMLPKPAVPTLADSWYQTALQWVKEGYSEEIPFNAYDVNGFVRFEPQAEVPVGSVLIFRDAKDEKAVGAHATVYAGCKNGYHWFYHVGNDNGPEFCAVERVQFGGADKLWPLLLVTPPTPVQQQIDALTNG